MRSTRLFRGTALLEPLVEKLKGALHGHMSAVIVTTNTIVISTSSIMRVT
jgi:hypothetical protein